MELDNWQADAYLKVFCNDCRKSLGEDVRRKLYRQAVYAKNHGTARKSDPNRRCIMCNAKVVVPPIESRPKKMRYNSLFCLDCFLEKSHAEREKARKARFQSNRKDNPTKPKKKGEENQTRQLPSTDPYFCKLGPCRRKAILDGWCEQHYNRRHTYESE